MGDIQEQCRCVRTDVTVLEMCQGCGHPTNFEELRQRAVDIYDRDGQPIEDPNLPRRHLRMGDPKTNLRVLHLNDSTSHVLSGTFECASTAHLPPYEAVSYTWGGDDGDYSKSEFIIINGKVFPITKNCAAALRKIRKRRGTRVIWIDSLCINQNDVNERSTQVSEMNKIYSGAQKVHIYLGSNIDDKTASEAFFVLSSTTNLREVQKSLSTDKHVVVKALQTFFAQPYFSRMWIVQEVLLAKTIKIHWGTATAPWQMFSNEHLEKLGECGMGDSIPEWMQIRISNKNFRKSEALDQLLFWVMGCRASDDRDKVYGIYGLLFDSEEEGLTVDYSLSVKQVYTNMAVHLITKHNALRAVLERAHDQAPLANGEHLPSWVPDFRSKCLPRSLSTSLYDLEIRSSISPNDVISSCGMDGLCLRGHRLRNLQDESEVGQLDSGIIRHKVVRLEGEWELARNSSLMFDQKDDTVFWASNGLLLHLRKHPTIEGAYTFLGPYELHLHQSGNSLPAPYPVPYPVPRPVPYPVPRPVPYPVTLPAPYPAPHPDPHPDPFLASLPVPYLTGRLGLESLDLQHLQLLWKFRTRLEILLHDVSVRRNFTTAVFPAVALGWEIAGDKLNASQDLYPRSSQDNSGQSHPLDADSQDVTNFQDFWGNKETRETLYELSTISQHPESFDIQNISKLCQDWLQYYDEVGHLIERFLATADEEMALRTMAPEELEAWERTTEKLLEALQWTERQCWPYKTAPDGFLRCHYKDMAGPLKPAQEDYEWDCDEDANTEGHPAKSSSQPMPGRWIKNNFDHVRSKLNQCAVDRSLWEYQDILYPWDESWAKVIRLIPYLLAIRDRFSYEELRTLMEDCEKFRMWKMTGIEVCQAEIITLL